MDGETHTHLYAHIHTHTEKERDTQLVFVTFQAQRVKTARLH